MEVPKNSYACAICQKRFNNPIILIKHVEFRHSSTKQSSKADNLKEKVAVTDSNQDPLETRSSKESSEEQFVGVESLPPSSPPSFKFVAIHEIENQTLQLYHENKKREATLLEKYGFGSVNNM